MGSFRHGPRLVASGGRGSAAAPIDRGEGRVIDLELAAVLRLERAVTTLHGRLSDFLGAGYEIDAARLGLEEAFLLLFDRLDGEADFEDGGDDEPSLGSLRADDQRTWARGCDDDREAGDDNGVADFLGQAWVEGGTVSLDEFRARRLRGRA